VNAHSRENEADGSWRTMTLLYLVIVLLLPFLMDFAVRLFLALGASVAEEFIRNNLWLPDVLGYGAIYAFMLFYLLATFEPLAKYGYSFSKEYLGLALYLGIGSGVVMYVVDRLAGNTFSGVSEIASLGVLLGYVLAWAVLPALVEETLFRGVIQGFYQRHFTKTYTPYGVHVAVFIGVGAEALFHLASPMYYGITQGGVINALLQTLPQMTYVVVFGFISGVLYQRTKSLVAPILIHALGNGTELLLLWLLA
jgi:membrane protease YdiL (CAAX protease family)